jgi:hypothetical protein
MPTSKRSNYKGYCITTQWSPLHLSDRRRGSGFDAAFAVSSITCEGESWQQFPRAVFDTPEAAEANALSAAQRSIDDLAHGPRRRFQYAL